VVTSATRRTSRKTSGSSANTIVVEVTNTRGSKRAKSILSYLKIYMKKAMAITNINFAAGSQDGFKYVSGKFIGYETKNMKKDLRSICVV
jgi:hypothetical protein